MLSPEFLHNCAITALRTPGIALLFEYLYQFPVKPVHIAGLDFPNRVGLAAGFDKNGVAAKGLAALGFGHIEFGTITKDSRQGHPKPRIWKKGKSLINHMGLPNCGADQFSVNLSSIIREVIRPLIIGVSINGNKREIGYLMSKCRRADYITINLSCPNINPICFDMSDDFFRKFFEWCHYIRCIRTQNKPLFVKLPADLNLYHAKKTIQMIEETSMDGVIATNAFPNKSGAESGRNIKKSSLRVVEEIAKYSKIPIIGCGGILSVQDARDYLNAGASLVQIYSGLVFNGPSFPSRLAKSL